ncbi:MAG: Pyruvate, phosphate dikinase, partial [Klenkia sp.]|nr:Pyruvate, phosphate dikinase [Klenkia sp.]
RTPSPVTEALAPALLDELRGTAADLERSHADVLDIEFTVERSVLFFLQVRSAKRTPEAAVQIAADLLAEGGVDPAAALRAVSVEQVRQVQRPGFDETEVADARTAGRVLTTGIGACPGQVAGELVLDPDRAVERAEAGVQVVLARAITSPADLHGMIAAEGIVTATGGSTSHAAVVARALGTCCVVGAGEVQIDERARTLTVAGRVLTEGDEVSLDGASGEFFAGRIATSSPVDGTAAMTSLLRAASEASGCSVFSRVTLPGDVDRAREAGATGLVSAIDDVLAATGHLDGLVDGLMDGAQKDDGFARLADLVEAELAPLLAAAGGLEVGVRAIDLVADESREVLQQTAVTTRHPELSLPLGKAGLVEAQLRGLTRALERASGDGPSPVHLAVRHVSDGGEAASLAELGASVGDTVSAGAYLTSPRACARGAEIAEHVPVLWVEVRALQAAVFGIPARHLLTAQPLDDYLERGLLSVDPRADLDPLVEDLLRGVVAGQGTVPSTVGIRVSGQVSEKVAAQLYRLGFRRFASDVGEVRPLLLALGKAALAG